MPLFNVLAAFLATGVVFRLIGVEPIEATKILIYGAGVVGTQLTDILKTDQTCSIAGFIDDDPSLKGWDILGIKVRSSRQLEEIIKEQNID